MHIENIATKLKVAEIARARAVGCTPQEIAALEVADFFEDAEAEIRAELSTMRHTRRLAMRAVSLRKPATRRTPRRSAAKKADNADHNDSDGARSCGGSYDTTKLNILLARWASPLLSPSVKITCGNLATYRGPTLLPRLPNVALCVTIYGDGPDRIPVLSWFDASNGVTSHGAVALIAHVLKIPPAAAAERAARFLSVVSAAVGGIPGLGRDVATNLDILRHNSDMMRLAA